MQLDLPTYLPKNLTSYMSAPQVSDVWWRHSSLTTLKHLYIYDICSLKQFILVNKIHCRVTSLEQTHFSQNKKQALFLHQC